MSFIIAFVLGVTTGVFLSRYKIKIDKNYTINIFKNDELIKEINIKNK